jgi:hypothetical protein
MVAPTLRSTRRSGGCGMPRRTLGWLGPLSGILFVVLLVVGAALSGGGDIDPNDPGTELAAELVDSRDEQQLSFVFFAGGLLFFAWFASYLRDRLRRAGDEAEWIVSAYWAGALLFGAAFLMLGFAQAASFTVEDYGSDVAAAKALVALDWNAISLMAPGIVAMGAATAILTLRHRVLPAWIGWLAVLVAVAGLIPFVGFLVFIVWSLVLAIFLLVEQRRAPSPSPAQ